MMLRLATTFGIALAAIGCGAATPTPTHPPPSAMTAETTHAPAPAPFDQHAASRIEEPTFLLELTSNEAASLDAPTTLTITLEGRGDFHVNKEYPLQIELGASDAAQLDTTALSHADATELSDARARFDLRVRWSAAGTQWVAARVHFAVCTEDTCMPDSRALAISVPVQ